MDPGGPCRPGTPGRGRSRLRDSLVVGADMVSEREADARARACLTVVARPGEPWLGTLLETHGAARVWADLRAKRPAPELPGVEIGAEHTRRRWPTRAQRGQ